MQFYPKVSIVIPVYNGSNYLREAIDSALAQTYSNIEVLVINDGSNDGGRTEAIAQSYGSQVRYFLKTNGGVASALNMGIREMKGDYFSWLSHDDVYYDFKITDQIAFLKYTPQEDVILYSNFDVIDEQSQLTGTYAIEVFDPSLLRYYLAVSHPVHGCTTLIPRICFEKCGWFDENLRTTQDYDFWFRLADKFKFIHLPVTHIKSRHHSEQGTIKLNSVHVQEVSELLIKFLYKLTPEEITGGTGKPLGLSYAYIAENFISRKFHIAGRKAMFKSVHYVMTQGLVDCLRTIFVLNILILRQARSFLFRNG